MALDDYDYNKPIGKKTGKVCLKNRPKEYKGKSSMKNPIKIALGLAVVFFIFALIITVLLILAGLGFDLTGFILRVF